MSFHVPNKYRLRHGVLRTTDAAGNQGCFIIGQLRCIAHDGVLHEGEPPELGGWEHVSVSRTDRCPTWVEMCAVKDLFWGDDDVVMQLHPALATYVNCHPYCLHLWRPIKAEIPLPPTALVGPRRG